ncbi:YbaN family protein [Ramlibacter sp. AN1015]|uniref:YbaN family protein n=1 Tax=Ramlibacter sp. AN1015 TaxID=3133428 RepID=UPI0030BACB59
MPRTPRQLLWRLLAVVSLAVGLVGVFLPVVPTVPFVLVAAWAAGRGWPRLEAWLLAHPRFGPPIRNWRAHGAVSRAAKRMALATMAASATLLWFLPVQPWLRGGVYAVFVAVGIWLWRRPEPQDTRGATRPDESAST